MRIGDPKEKSLSRAIFLFLFAYVGFFLYFCRQIRKQDNNETDYQSLDTYPRV